MANRSPNPAMIYNIQAAEQDGYDNVNDWYIDIMERLSSRDPRVARKAEQQEKVYYENIERAKRDFPVQIAEFNKRNGGKDNLATPADVKRALDKKVREGEKKLKDIVGPQPSASESAAMSQAASDKILGTTANERQHFDTIQQLVQTVSQKTSVAGQPLITSSASPSAKTQVTETKVKAISKDVADASKIVDRLASFAGNIAKNIQNIAEKMGAYVTTLKETMDALKDEREDQKEPTGGDTRKKAAGSFFKSFGDIENRGGILGVLGQGFMEGAGKAVGRRAKTIGTAVRKGAAAAGGAVKTGASAIFNLLKNPKTIIFALVAAIGTGIYKYFTDDEFKKSVNSFFSKALDFGKDMILKPLMNLFGSLKEGLYNLVANVFDVYSSISIPIPAWLQKLGLPEKLEPYSFLKGAASSLRTAADESKKAREAEAAPAPGAAGAPGATGATGTSGTEGAGGASGAPGAPGASGAAAQLSSDATKTAVASPEQDAQANPVAAAMKKAGVAEDPSTGTPTYKGVKFHPPATVEDLNKVVKAIDDGTPVKYNFFDPVTGQTREVSLTPPPRRAAAGTTADSKTTGVGGAEASASAPPGAAASAAGGAAATTAPSASEGGAAAAPVESAPTTGEDLGTQSADVAYKKTAPPEDVAVIDNSKNDQSSMSQIAGEGKIPSPIADRGALDRFNYFDIPGMMKEA